MPKVVIVIPRDLLREVDDAAQLGQTDRNAFICRSLRNQLRSERLHQLRQQILEDARAIAGDFHGSLNPGKMSMRAEADRGARQIVEGAVTDAAQPGRADSFPRRPSGRQRTGGRGASGRRSQ